MSIEPKHVSFDEFVRDAQALFDEVERDGQPVVVERAGKLFTLRPPKARRRKKTGIITADDPMWSLMGAFSTEPNNDVVSNKYKYIAEAIAAHARSGGDQTSQQENDSIDTDGQPTSVKPS
jgi:hypothetical protein